MRAVLMAPSLSLRNSSVVGMMRKVPDGAAMVAATFAATLAALLVAAPRQTRLLPSFPAVFGVKRVVSLPVALCGLSGPNARDAAAATELEDLCKLHEGKFSDEAVGCGCCCAKGVMTVVWVPVLLELAWAAALTVLKGDMIVAWIPVLLVLAWAATVTDFKGAVFVVLLAATETELKGAPFVFLAPVSLEMVLTLGTFGKVTERIKERRGFFAFKLLGNVETRFLRLGSRETTTTRTLCASSGWRDRRSTSGVTTEMPPPFVQKHQQQRKVLEVVPGQELLKRRKRSSLGKEVSSFS